MVHQALNLLSYHQIPFHLTSENFPSHYLSWACWVVVGKDGEKLVRRHVMIPRCVVVNNTSPFLTFTPCVSPHATRVWMPEVSGKLLWRLPWSTSTSLHKEMRSRPFFLIAMNWTATGWFQLRDKSFARPFEGEFANFASTLRNAIPAVLAMPSVARIRNDPSSVLKQVGRSLKAGFDADGPLDRCVGFGWWLCRPTDTISPRV